MLTVSRTLLWLGLALTGAPGVRSHPAADSTSPVLSLDVIPRALPDSPSGDYAPAIVDCPRTRPSIRLADRLSDDEASWVRRRRNNTIEPMRDLLVRAAIPDFDAAAYINRVRDNTTALPNIGIAFSGGGYRALMNGAGFLTAADSRNRDLAEHATAVAGLLQSATYIAGLSGGGWLVGSVFANNFSTVPALQRGAEDSPLWRFDRSILRGPRESGIGILNTIDYWRTIHDQVSAKAAGWDTSITDYWGRALSYQLVNATDGGPAYTFSSIANSPHFRDAEAPFPILVADGRAPGERIISLNATVYEFNPFEIGSWDPTTYGFAPLRWLASNFTDGTVGRGGGGLDDDNRDDNNCVRGFDQIGFVMGTSSSLFNQIILQNTTAAAADTPVPSFVVDAIESILRRLDRNENDIAQYEPNPFYRWNPTGQSHNADARQLSLVDGGEDLQNIPLHPLIQPFRALDVIFAVDSSADTHNSWPNGTALRATYDRVATEIGNGTLFPAVPDADTFINLGLNRRPTFFGCDAANFTSSRINDDDDDDDDLFVVPPLIIYVPNAPYTVFSNVSTFQPSYPLGQRDAIIRNGFNSATRGNNTLDEEWPVCVACAVLSRSWWKANESAPDACARCFDRYCWDGSTDTAPVRNYDPAYIIGPDFGSEENAAAGLPGSRGPWALSAMLGVAVLMVAL
ncbi:hypothetical protein SODALDRAFT_269732 [Sodiomyces alkalinus F11]|uniref:Lysophospholipase n=1 Tax=Sodiomyces alkalinus (strain CBS 110278 / VKM F-3762 / F11) TaxID=1314773 RepID=A0A3N2QA64_SODAK|nr:hypothetical protein SODALDRAFT_269732 [Sodiomyces alkalinus F11]ROT43641.1 hypothetical protein SODALDRAFT_269732 [Sodiomyces alkalinus F11]